MTIFGTRPEATKMCPIIKELEKQSDIIPITCITAQHREMLDQVLEIFDVKPDYDLNIMTGTQTLTEITTRALVGLEKVIKKSNVDIILVHGDTTTTLAGGLAGFYAKIPVGHVEAGLRTYNKYEPYPEEMNRKLTTALAELHFAPTECAKHNLIQENVEEKNIFVTGNTAVDCLKSTVEENFKFEEKILNEIDYKNEKVIVMTAHRRENIGKPLQNICEAVRDICKDFSNVRFVYAVHPNKYVKKTAHEILSYSEKVELIEPLDMKQMHNLMNKAYAIVTDSGGIQEEAPSLNKPVLVLRNVTERPEGLRAGTLKLTGLDKKEIYDHIANLLSDEREYLKMANAKNPFGDGEASGRIVKTLLYKFGYIPENPNQFV